MADRRDRRLRCDCSRSPLLGVIVRETDTGRFGLHVKVFKQGRIYGEVLAFGDVNVRCWACQRWTHIRFVHEKAVLTTLDFDPVEAVGAR